MSNMLFYILKFLFYITLVMYIFIFLILSIAIFESINNGEPFFQDIHHILNILKYDFHIIVIHKDFLIKTLIIFISISLSIFIIENYSDAYTRKITRPYRSKILNNDSLIRDNKSNVLVDIYELKYLNKYKQMTTGKLIHKLKKINKRYEKFTSNKAFDKAISTRLLIYELRDTHFNRELEKKNILNYIYHDRRISHKHNPKLRYDNKSTEKTLRDLNLSSSITMNNISIFCTLLFVLIVLLFVSICVQYKIFIYKHHLLKHSYLINIFKACFYKIIDMYIIPVSSLIIAIMSILMANSSFDIFRNHFLMILLNLTIPIISFAEFYRIMDYYLKAYIF